MTRTHILHATTREWVDDVGKKHKHRIEVGAIFHSKTGRMVVKLDAFPITKDFSGWLSAEPCAPALPPGRRVSPGMPPAPPTTAESPEDEDMPF